MTCLAIDTGWWITIADGDPRAAAIYSRHYSCHRYGDRRRSDPTYRNRHLIIGPGEKTLMLGRDGRSIFAWRRFIDDSGQNGVNNCIFHRESGPLASEQILAGVRFAWSRWPGERLYTYVDPDGVRSTNPGYCYIMAGWQYCGQTAGGKLVYEFLPTWGYAVYAREVAS